MWRSTSTRNYRRKQRLRCLRAVLLRHSGSTVGGATMRRKSVKLERDEASPRMVAPHDFNSMFLIVPTALYVRKAKRL